MATPTAVVEAAVALLNEAAGDSGSALGAAAGSQEWPASGLGEG